MLIFDLDGTLIDSSLDIAFAINQTFEEMGEPPPSMDKVLEFIGTGVLNLVEERFKGRDGALKQARDIYDRHYSRCLVDRTRLYDGMLEVLDSFSGVSKAIVTNKRQKYADVIVRELSIDSYFVGVYGAEAFARRKPDPLPLRRALEIHGGSGSSSWMIGDTCADIMAAQSAGVRSCAVLYGYSSRSVLLEQKADAYVGHARDLKKILLA